MITLVCGENIFGCEQKLRDLIGENTAQIDISEPEAMASLEESALAQSLFGGESSVVVRYIDQAESLHEKLIKFFERVPKDNLVIIYLPGLKAGNLVAKKFLKIANEKHVEQPLSPSELSIWVRAEFQKRGAEVGGSVASFLVDFVGSDQVNLLTEIEKLSAFSTKITQDDVKRLAIASPQTTVFQMLDAMVAGRGETALNYYQDLLEQQFDPHYIMSMICWQASAMTIAVAGRKNSPAEAAKETGLSPFVLRKASETTKRLNAKALMRLNEQILQTDVQIKSEMVDAERSVEQLIRKIAFLQATA